MASHLSRGKLNISLLQEQSRKELLDLLDRCDGCKTIIWDDSLSGPFGLISEYSLLRKRDVVKMHPLRPGKLLSVDTDNVIFIVRPSVKLMDFVAQNVHGEETGTRKKIRKWHIFFVPRRNLVCEEHLKIKGVYGSFTTIDQIPSCILFPLDNDLLSMELTNAFAEYHIENDMTCLYEVAEAIIMLQKLYGPLKRICGKGDCVSHIWKLVNNLKNEVNAKSNLRTNSNCQIDHLLILDRGIDILSTLVTQLTYEGLIDELYSINNCTVKLPADKFAQDEGVSTEAMPEKKLVVLNSADEIFSEIRDKSFNSVGQVLSKKAKHISTQFDERHNGRTLQEMKQFVSKLPQMLALKKCLSTHMTIAEMIKNATEEEEFLQRIACEQELLFGVETDKVHPYIEDCIARKDDINKVLRLICIQCAVNSGLKTKLLDHYKRDIIQTYGFRHLLTLSNLEKAGLIKVQQGSRSYTVLRKTMKLTSENNESTSPRDITYVHHMYAPLSVRLVQHFAKTSSWRSLTDVISLLPGPLIDQPFQQENRIFPQRRGSVSSENDSVRVILVFFVGGCTLAEVSALRFLSQLEDANVEFVIATTKIINANSFISSIAEPL